MHDPIPESFGTYEILQLVNRSKTGDVFKARHKAMGRIVALKILSSEATASHSFVERFYRKTQILANLEHPNLVRAYEAGEREGTHYLAMEFVDGTDLRSQVKRHGPLDVRQAVGYMIQAARGLGAAHARGVTHRNLKPSNFLVDSTGRLKVVGLGMAHMDDCSQFGANAQRLTLVGQVLGTYEFMSPEQALDSLHVDVRCDIYSLGCSLYWFLTGRNPYPGKTPFEQVEAHRTMPIPSLRTLRPETPPVLDAIFQKMIAKAPDERYASAEELINALSGVFPERIEVVAGQNLPPGGLAVSSPAEQPLPSPAPASSVTPPPAKPAVPPAMPEGSQATSTPFGLSGDGESKLSFGVDMRDPGPVTMLQRAVLAVLAVGCIAGAVVLAGLYLQRWKGKTNQARAAVSESDSCPGSTSSLATPASMSKTA